jgi:hypothetical protein
MVVRLALVTVSEVVEERRGRNREKKVKETQKNMVLVGDKMSNGKMIPGLFSSDCPMT